MIKQKHLVWTILWLVFIASGMLQPKNPVFSYIFMFSAIAISIGFGVMFTKAVKDKVFLCIIWLVVLPAFSALIGLLLAMLFKGNETSSDYRGSQRAHQYYKLGKASGLGADSDTLRSFPS